MGPGFLRSPAVCPGVGACFPTAALVSSGGGSKAGDARGKLPRLPGDFPLRFSRLVITSGEVMKPSRVPGGNKSSGQAAYAPE